MAERNESTQLDELSGAIDWSIRECDNPTDPRNPMVATSPDVRAFLEGAYAILRSLRREQPEHPMLENLMKVYLTAKGERFFINSTKLTDSRRDPLGR